jgi:thimet oligopeptidase
VQRQLLEFRLAGVDKDDATRARLKQLNDDLTGEVTLYERNIADDQRSVDVTGAAELNGLPQHYIDRYKPGADGKIRITTDYPDIFPVLKFGKNQELRRRLYEEFDNRAYPKNRDLLQKMMQTRYEIATLLSWVFFVGRLQRRRQNGRQWPEHRELYPRSGCGGSSGRRA